MYILYALQVSMVIKGVKKATYFPNRFIQCRLPFDFMTHPSVTVAEVHPTLLENNGYKTMPIKTTLSHNNVKYQHLQVS